MRASYFSNCIFAVPLLVACSGGSPVTTTGDSRVITSPGWINLTEPSACVCTPVGNASLDSVYVTSLPCYCGASGCKGYEASVADLCAHSYYQNPVESTFAGCHLRRITYDWGASGNTVVFDTSTGDFVGGRFDDDTPGVCPGTQEKIGFSLAAGTYDVDPSCQLTGQRNPCEGTDGGPGGEN
jgi:hypothetical protein